MRNEKEIFVELIRWASKEPAARAMLLTGSRAGDPALIDLLSDYDIELIVDPLSAFKTDEWLSTFGPIKAKISQDVADRSTRLVLYEDGVRIDFQLYEPKEFTRKSRVPMTSNDWDMGWKVLMDKDSIASALATATYQRFRITPPTRQVYDQLINDFWWDTTYVAKSLWRDELFYAKYMLDGLIRFTYFKTMIEWHIGLKNEWQVSAGKQGRSFKSFLDDRTWSRIEATFVGGDPAENWNALFEVTAVFSSMAKEIGRDLTFEYPYGLEDRMMKYLHGIKSLESGAGDFQT